MMTPPSKATFFQRRRKTIRHFPGDPSMKVLKLWVLGCVIIAYVDGCTG